MQNAVRQAAALGILTSEEWRLTAWRSAPNTVRIVSAEWRAWLRMRDRKRAGADHPLQAESTAPSCAGRAIDPTQRDQLQAELEATPQVQRVYYESKEQAYARFREQFKDSPDLVANVTADILPESFRVKLRDPTQFEVVASAFRGRPGLPVRGGTTAVPNASRIAPS